MMIEKDGKELTLAEFEKLTGAKWLPQLDFSDFSISGDLAKKGAKLHEKGEITLEQMWLGSYFKKELTEGHKPGVVIRWIDPQIGWGVFAARDFKKREFIAEYAGQVRKKQKADAKNAYCFEYILAPGFTTPYNIDARDQGGLGRYLNHSPTPNLLSALATYQNISHVIFCTKEPIAKGTQLCYDYGPDYWSKRTAPIAL
jgi:hypothetical protein